MKKTILLLVSFAFLSFKNNAQTVSDIDGNIYNTVTIGTQVWMKENLKTTKYNNGDLILTTVPDTLDVSAEATPNYQWAYNGADSNVSVYGRLYTWYAITDYRGVCPTNWHVPTDDEWEILITFLGGNNTAGGKMKESGTINWDCANTGANDSSGFSGLPSGYRWKSGKFYNLGQSCDLWSATEVVSDQTKSWARDLNCSSISVMHGQGLKDLGESVRCISDFASSSIDFLDFNNIVKIFPTPANERITISFNYPHNFSLSIYNIIGTLILQQELIDEKTTISIGSLSKGIYVIKLTGSDCSIQRKFIKE